MQPPGQFRLLTLHYGLYQLAVAMALGFGGAYLMQVGFTFPQALLAFAGLLAIRFCFRLIGRGIVRRLGFRRTIIAGACLGAVQFWPMLHAAEAWGLASWLLLMAFAESLYWPVYHAAVAVTGVEGSRGRELGMRTAVGAFVGIIGPFMGGLLMQHAGAGVNFALGGALMAASAIPLAFMRDFDAGPVPTASWPSLSVDLRAVSAFAADGWMSSGLHLAWPMVLFVVLGSNWESFGLANAIAGMAGAAGGLICGRAIDRGSRDKYLAFVSLALAIGFALRAAAGWSATSAVIANATAAAVMGVYVPVLMSHIYDRAKTSGAAYRFHFVAEAGWDFGAASGCIVAAGLVSATGLPSLAVVPGAFGILIMYLLVRRQQSRADASGDAAHASPRTSARSSAREIEAAPDA